MLILTYIYHSKSFFKITLNLSFVMEGYLLLFLPSSCLIGISTFLCLQSLWSNQYSYLLVWLLWECKNRLPVGPGKEHKDSMVEYEVDNWNLREKNQHLCYIFTHFWVQKDVKLNKKSLFCFPITKYFLVLLWKVNFYLFPTQWQKQFIMPNLESETFWELHILKAATWSWE